MNMNIEELKQYETEIEYRRLLLIESFVNAQKENFQNPPTKEVIDNLCAYLKVCLKKGIELDQTFTTNEKELKKFACDAAMEQFKQTLFPILKD